MTATGKPVVNRTDSQSDLFASGGEMGALMRNTDWSKTKLGPVDTWPQSLKTMLGVVLGSRFPMLVWWGPDLLHLYNDAYRPILRDKHPASLAAPASEVWAEVWSVAGPMARSVQDGGPATWTEDLQLFINSGDMAEETYFTFSYSPIPDDEGCVGGVLNTVQETTAKVQSERQVRMLHDLATRASEAKSEREVCRRAIEVLGENELDLPFALLYTVNDNATQVELAASSGWTDSDPLGQRAAIDTPIWPFAEAMRSRRDVLIDDLVSRFEKSPAGRWNERPTQARVMPLFRTGRSAPCAFLVLGVSPHRALDERYERFFRATADQIATVLANAHAYEIEAQRAESLAELDRAKTTFFSNVSHELRTPLTLILGPVEDALGGGRPLDGPALATVQRSAVRLLRLVNSLLDFARLEAGKSHSSFSETDITTLTRDLASSFRSLVERGGLRFTVDCQAITEPVYVDAAKWERIVLNLVSNAFKFTLSGEIVVALRSHGDHIELTVRDTGSGIPQGELAQIFDRFHRVVGAKGRSFEGTGIGLSFVKELVHIHGGTIRVSSTEGKGSTFSVSIPTGSAHLPAEQLSTQPTSTTNAPAYLLEAAQWIDTSAAIDETSLADDSDSTVRRSKARVLVVDDNADMRTYLARLLSTRWQVELAEDGEAAFALARNQPPDLVLSDVMMPRLDGIGLLRALREDPKTSHVPVVLLSARAGEEPVIEGIEAGADDYLVKPFAARELLARVQTHLELAKVRRDWSSELERANRELEAFSYSVSHDLRAPLRAIDGFSKALLTSHSERLDEQGRHYLARVRSATRRMAQLIDDLLGLSRITRASLTRERTDISGLVRKLSAELRSRDANRDIEVHVSDDLVENADPRLLGIVFENLLSNAWKFTANRDKAIVEIGKEEHADATVFFVRDNGAGFSMDHASRLFAPFQRLHTEAQFEGTGIGLATVRRVVDRHGGHVWAEAAPDRGATFYFTLRPQL